MPTAKHRAPIVPAAQHLPPDVPVVPRLVREQVFWDAAHADDTVRDAAQKFYAVCSERSAFYHQRVLAAASDPAARALEIGGFTGGACFSLAVEGVPTVAINLSPATVDLANQAIAARRLAGVLRFEVMDAEALDLPDDAFSVVCGTAIIHHLDLSRAVPEIVRVLKPGGTAIFTEPLGHNPLINAYRRRTPAMRTPDEHPLTMADLAHLGTYFEEMEVSCFHLTSLGAILFRNSRLFRPTLRTLEALDRALFRLPPLRRMAWYVVIALKGPRK